MGLELRRTLPLNGNKSVFTCARVAVGPFICALRGHRHTSPVHNCRKFSQVLGQLSVNKSMTIRPMFTSVGALVRSGPCEAQKARLGRVVSAPHVRRA